MADVAVLMTCHNRVDTTLRCLRSLIEGTHGPSVEVFLVDDGSSDATGDRVVEAFPTVNVIQGSGALFWAGGMRVARAAAGDAHTYYLWLNDDVVLRPGALEHLVESSRRLEGQTGRPAIVIGALADAVTGETTYSGVERTGPLKPTSYRQVGPTGVVQRCDTFNGNVVLIPAPVERAVGGMDPGYTHAAGDFDYGLRAARLGFSSWVAPGHVGTCSRNPDAGSWRDSSLSLRDRWSLVRGRKGLPFRDWARYTRAHAGPLWPLYFLSPYVRLAAGGSLSRRRATNRVGSDAQAPV